MANPNMFEVGSSSWKFFPASCTLCSSGNRTLGPQHCVAVGIRLMTLSRDEDTKVSRGTRKRRRWGPSAGRHAHFQRQAAAQEEPRREHEWRSPRSNFPLQIRRPSGDGFANTVHRRGLPHAVELFLSNVTSARRDSVLTSPDSRRPQIAYEECF